MNGRTSGFAAVHRVQSAMASGAAPRSLCVASADVFRTTVLACPIDRATAGAISSTPGFTTAPHRKNAANVRSAGSNNNTA